ncbi:MAG: nitrogen fixation protein [gamma proteobacterium symbiont of Bathyaustriella thionipta]|nr:nitrogen fixation protein [gamma proteobacterium symbiont of Bathyaustriella thionipta]MCU7950726.1 nitrogen fixation protein [gamma proteobacterium symbiont of Bathyaustriella thionipta]MCU7954269.1 nitrogen fixation protein [gamma proteobacterium symbiont of Bathyaustriella thionipta]MCU7957218.1 nitrogen fixation protein [gamma proteobacterium symbiont of Bathyaustriella thionipta]MCU7966819.1 nitrogen fixation protein [gamma proteobacterium symbiont of Bathyaustriella thionipta]
MKVAITSQNRKTITSHAGKCRKFWIVEIENNEVINKELLELAIEQSFHSSSPFEPHPFDTINILVTGGMGNGLVQRLSAKGIQGLVTSETDLDKAISALLAGTLKHEADKPHDQHHV